MSDTNVIIVAVAVFSLWSVVYWKWIA